MILEDLQIHFAIKVGVAASLALFLGVGFSQVLNRPDAIVSGMWTVVTAVVVVQSYLGSTYIAAGVRFLGTVIGTFMAGFCTTFFGSNAISIGFSNFITILLCSLLKVKDSVRIASLTVTVLMILWRLKPEISPWAFGFFRLMDSCLGILIAVVVTHTLFPKEAIVRVRECILCSLQKMHLLYRDCLYKSQLEGNEKKNGKIEEWKREIEELFHDGRMALEESKSELLTRAPIDDWNFFLDHVEDAFKSIMDLWDIKKSRHSDYIYSHFRSKIKTTIDEIDLAMEELIFVMERKNVNLVSDLSGGLSLLRDELEKFKEGTFQEVKGVIELQNLFVFLYSLRLLGEQLNKLKGRIPAIQNIN